jgi:hypothetical protein
MLTNLVVLTYFTGSQSGPSITFLVLSVADFCDYHVPDNKFHLRLFLE